ncbi:MAG: hypothetical protein FJZ09_03235 [Candidatus Omnitrophica bacterium]|nr:hypothetical protein [Candidatus Omnitrophota bacterium]
MTKSPFRQAIILSLLGHAAFFGAFTFSFGRPIAPAAYHEISFWGQVLYNSQVSPSGQKDIRPSGRSLFLRPGTSMLEEKVSAKEPLSRGYLKPQSIFSLSTEKLIPPQAKQERPFRPKRKEPTIVFHPLLPYSFPLYFKDRQVAHVELEFKVISTPSRSFTVVKRKISSGSLEADLLTTRYIGRYLFMQRQRFSPNTWQTVKIDLSAESD